MCASCKEDKLDTSDKDSPSGIVLSYSFAIPESFFKLPYDEFVNWIERQLTPMKTQLVRKAKDAFIERETDKDFPTEFTRS